MKVKALLLVAFAFVAMSVNGQDLKFGAKGGLNFANLSSDADGAMAVGVHLGGFAQYGINENILLQPELLLSFEGCNDFEGGKKLSFTWINIPVMGVYKISAVQGLSVEAGLQLGFLIGAKYDGETEIAGDKVKDSFKSTNLSLNLGAGYAITDNISVGARYCIGLSDLNDMGGGDKYSQNNFQLSVAYKF